VRDFEIETASPAPVAGSFKRVAEDWLKHYVDAKQPTSKDEIGRHLEKYVYRERKPFFEIRRRTVNELPDRTADKHSPAQAMVCWRRCAASVIGTRSPPSSRE
jgi:hypothetical protein